MALKRREAVKLRLVQTLKVLIDVPRDKVAVSILGTLVGVRARWCIRTVDSSPCFVQESFLSYESYSDFFSEDSCYKTLSASRIFASEQDDEIKRSRSHIDNHDLRLAIWLLRCKVY